MDNISVAHPQLSSLVNIPVQGNANGSHTQRCGMKHPNHWIYSGTVLLKQHIVHYTSIIVHLNLHTLRKYDLLACRTGLKQRCQQSVYWLFMVCQWGRLDDGLFRIDLHWGGFRVGHQLPAANFIMHPGQGLNNSTMLQVQDLLNQRLGGFHRAEGRFM